MERVMGIEPTLAAWEAAVLPLNYTRDPYRFYKSFLMIANRGWPRQCAAGAGASNRRPRSTYASDNFTCRPRTASAASIRGSLVG